jgi:hypothetical protein
MSVTAQDQSCDAGIEDRDDGIEEHRLAAAVHERLLVVTGFDNAGLGEPVSTLVETLLHLHAPVPLAMNYMFMAQAAPPVCRGCDQRQRAATREAPWPCTTYAAIARHLLDRPGVHLSSFPEGTVALFPLLQSHRAGRAHRQPTQESSAIRDLRPADPS